MFRMPNPFTCIVPGGRCDRDWAGGRPAPRRESVNKNLRRGLRSCNYWLLPLIDARRIWTALFGYAWYFRDWRRYRSMPGAETLRLADARPLLNDRTSVTPFDAHYFYVNGWAMRRIVKNAPPRHADVGSDIMFVNLLASVVPVTFVDYRPLMVKCAGMMSVAGDALSLPFATGSVPSLSSLHVTEHIGLGRYGDRLNPQGTLMAASELERALAPNGSLFFALPVGKPRTCFNAHRIHDSKAIREHFSRLDLVEFSGVHDDGTFVENTDLAEFSNDDYACGMFWFRKVAS